MCVFFWFVSHRWKTEGNRFRLAPWRIESIPTIVKVKDVRMFFSFLCFWGYWFQFTCSAPGVERVPVARSLTFFVGCGGRSIGRGRYYHQQARRSGGVVPRFVGNSEVVGVIVSIVCATCARRTYVQGELDR